MFSLWEWEAVRAVCACVHVFVCCVEVIFWGGMIEKPPPPSHPATQPVLPCGGNEPEDKQRASLKFHALGERRGIHKAGPVICYR